MCEGGRVLADFLAGTFDEPDVPDEVAECLTTTADGRWVVWAHKLARPSQGEFRPLSGIPVSYAVDAVARCLQGQRHTAPDPDCTCGFHALSAPWPGIVCRLPSVPFGRPSADGIAQFDVALSGRVLAFEWGQGGLLFRAERQTVVRTHTPDTAPSPAEAVWRRKPDDPDDRLARTYRRRPHGAGPVRLCLPEGPVPVVEIDDDAGYCAVEPVAVTTRKELPALLRV